MRLEHVVVDSRDPDGLARWWAEAVGWVVRQEDPGRVVVCERLDDEGGPAVLPELVFVAVDDPGLRRERIHLDLNSWSLDDQAATVERLLGIGAVHADVGQADDAPFVVLADPEGSNFCVLDPRPGCADLGTIAGFTLAAHHAEAIADLWQAATGWVRADEDEPGYVTLTPPDRRASDLEVITRPTMPASTARNRIHLDVRPETGEDHAAAVDALVALGARVLAGAEAEAHAHDTPEGTVVLVDVEGNHVCVLPPA